MFRKAETKSKPMDTLLSHLGSIFVSKFSRTFVGQIAESILFQLDREYLACPKNQKMIFLSELKGSICFVASQKVIVDIRYIYGGDIIFKCE